MTRLCDIDGCDRKHAARGLCGSHYNQAHQTNRHAKVEATCAGCGKTVMKDAGNAKRYANVFCSLLCRDYYQHGALSSNLPADHMARWVDATCEWTPPLMPRGCQWCGTEFQPRTQRGAFCSRVCKKRQYKTTRRGREAGAPGTYTWMDVVRLWRTFGGTCAYCTTPTPLTEIQAEHVHPISKGGANNLTNLLPSCLQCNSDKRDLTLNEWKHDRERRRLPHVLTEWSSDDSRFAHLVTHSRLTIAA